MINYSFVPIAIKSKQMAYRFYDRAKAEAVLDEKLAPENVKRYMLSENYRTYGMLLTEFQISRIDLYPIVKHVYPCKRWTMNARMSRECYENIKQEIIKREFKRRR